MKDINTWVQLIKKESRILLAVFIITYVIFQIVFYKQSFTIVLRTVFSLYWVFIFPGYFLMLYWHKKISVIERLVIGSLVAAAATGVISYHLGLIGINIKYHSVLLPLILIIIGVLIIFIKNPSDKQN